MLLSTWFFRAGGTRPIAMYFIGPRLPDRGVRVFQEVYTPAKWRLVSRRWPDFLPDFPTWQFRVLAEPKATMGSGSSKKLSKDEIQELAAETHCNAAHDQQLQQKKCKATHVNFIQRQTSK